MTAPLYVTCLGLVCPVGFSPEAVVAAMRAGIDAFGDLSYLDDTGQPIIGAAVPGLDQLRGHKRITELLGAAMAEARDRFPEHLRLPLPLILCTGEPDRPGPNLTGVVSEVEARLKLSFRRDGSAHLPLGSVGAFRALELVKRILAETDVEACLVAAVDTFVDAQALAWLDRAKRLKKEGHSDGVIPGEAACVALVSRGRLSRSDLTVRGLGFGLETATVLNEEPSLGRGMSSAVRDALTDASLVMEDVAFRLGDVAGESYAFEELVVAQVRNLRTPRECQDLLHPAGSIGECGAASGLVQLAWAEQAFARGYACGPIAIAQCSVPSGARAAAVVSSEIA